MLDIELVLDEIDILKSKLDWAQEEIAENITVLKNSLDHYEKIKKEINEFSSKTRAKLL